MRPRRDFADCLQSPRVLKGQLIYLMKLHTRVLQFPDVKTGSLEVCCHSCLLLFVTLLESQKDGMNMVRSV